MITFIISLLLLILGYIFYGALVDRVFGADPQRQTPCYASQDGVDYLPMPTWKVFLIQFLNIAGTGPIFGAIQGILFGPSAYLWIVLGCIFGGAVHDYMAGMISLRKNGASLPEIVGDNLGQVVRVVMRVLSLVLMVLVGAVFVTTPADILDGMMSDQGFLWSKNFWVIIIFVYYILATLLPIDKLIGKIYPVFGCALLVMAVGVGYGVFVQAGSMPEITEAFSNHHPASAMPIFPGLCITIACGAVSGFHATQSPMMARCLKTERHARPIFYGAMVAEGIVALIWAAAAIAFTGGYEGLQEYVGSASPAILVDNLSKSWLGTFGGILAILGVVAAPITTGDTALRSARLIAADFMNIKQKKLIKRLAISIPIFGLCFIVMLLPYDALWRYFAWCNQILAVFTLWTATVWLAKENKFYYISMIPALFMTCVTVTYIFFAPEGFPAITRVLWNTDIPYAVALMMGLLACGASLACFRKYIANYKSVLSLQ